MFKGQAKRTVSWATVRKPKDRRNGQFSGVERRPLNPAPSFLPRTLSARFCERIEGCGKKVEKKNSCLSFVLIQTPYLLFYRKKVAKSSVKGLSMGAPLLKTDRFGDPAASSRITDARNLGQHKPAFQFAMLHA